MVSRPATPRSATGLPLPPHYNPDHARAWGYAPDETALFAAARDWRQTHGIASAGSDVHNVHLLIIDAQKDFCFPEGSLYVGGHSGGGAMDDNARLASFIYREMGALTRITTTLDTHFSHQIFFSSFWVDADDRPVPAHTTITTEAIDAGRVRPTPMAAWFLCNGNYAWLTRQVAFYCRELERAGKYELYLWPLHCLLGGAGHALAGAGHALAGVIHEARLFHSFVRGSQSWAEVKGGNPLTENYSVLRPEVLMRFDGHPLAQKNTNFVKTLLTSDAVIIGGQAASHCVKSSIDDLLDEIVAQDPALARKVYLLEDCMSSVVVRDGAGAVLADFTPQADRSLDRFRQAGMHVVRSTDPLASWPLAISY